MSKSNLLKVIEKLLQNLLGLSFLNSQSNVNAAFGVFKNSKKYIIFYRSYLYGSYLYDTRHLNDKKEEFRAVTSPLCPNR